MLAKGALRSYSSSVLGVFVFIVGVLAPLLLASGSALAGVADVTEMSLYEAYQLALESNHDIRTAEESVKQGELLQKKALTVLFPRLTANAGYSSLTYDDGTSSDGASWGLSLNQTVYNGGRVWVARRGARYTLNAARRGLEFARQSVLLDLIARANELLTAEDLLKVSEKREERVREQLRQAQARLELGDIARTSVLNAQVSLSTVILETVEAEKAVALAQKRLSNLIGADLAVRVEVPEVLTSLDEKPLEALIERAIDDRADLAQSRELIRIAREEAELTSRKGNPDVDITGSYTQYSDENPFAPETQVGIVFTWPFYQGGLVRIETKESLSRVRQTEEAYGSQIDTATLQVEETWLTVQTRKTQKQLVQDNLLTAIENHRLAKARFDLGAASSLEVLDAEEDLAEAENIEVNYKYNTRTARAALLYAVGALDLESFGEGIQTEGSTP